MNLDQSKMLKSKAKSCSQLRNVANCFLVKSYALSDSKIKNKMFCQKEARANGDIKSLLRFFSKVIEAAPESGLPVMINRLSIEPITLAIKKV